MRNRWMAIPAIPLFAVLFLILSVSTTLIGVSGYVTMLNENQVLYLFSTTGQVISAIYGLTLTGFIFFRNELSREEFEDDTLFEAVEALKTRYFVLLMFITFLVMLTIFLSNLVIAKEAAGPTVFNAVIINSGQSAFLTSLLAIAYFVFDVISPKRIEKASRRLQDEFDPSRSEKTKGSLESFLKNYNQIELLLNEVGMPYQQRVVVPISSDRGRPRHMSNIRLAEILFRNERINFSLFHQLRELVTLRNSIIHGAEPIVSQQAVEISFDVLQQLTDAVLQGESK